VTGWHETNVSVGDVALERFRSGGQEERIVAAPHREQRRPAGAEVLVEHRVERHVARVVEHQVELDLVGTAASEVVVVEAVAVRADPRRVGDAVRVLPDRRLRLHQRPDTFPVGLRRVLPVRLKGSPAVAQPFLVGVAVLGDDRRDALGVPGRDPEPDRRAVVEHVQGEAIETEHLGEAVDNVGDALERVAEVRSGGHVRFTEAGQVRGNDVKPVGEQRDQLAEHVARGRETMQEHQGRCVSRSGLPVEHRQTSYVCRAVSDITHKSSPLLAYLDRRLTDPPPASLASTASPHIIRTDSAVWSHIPAIAHEATRPPGS
jgi:hypothetical protein